MEEARKRNQDYEIPPSFASRIRDHGNVFREERSKGDWFRERDVGLKWQVTEGEKPEGLDEFLLGEKAVCDVADAVTEQKRPA